MAVTGSWFGWIYWDNGKRFRRIPYVEGERFLERHELSPPPPTDGRLDYWKQGADLFLEDPGSGERYEFHGGGVSAWNAAKTFVRVYDRVQRIEPGCCPIIRVDTKQVPQPPRLPYWVPVFKVLGWVAADGREFAA